MHNSLWLRNPNFLTYFSFPIRGLDTINNCKSKRERKLPPGYKKLNNKNVKNVLFYFKLKTNYEEVSFIYSHFSYS